MRRGRSLSEEVEGTFLSFPSSLDFGAVPVGSTASLPAPGGAACGPGGGDSSASIASGDFSAAWVGAFPAVTNIAFSPTRTGPQSTTVNWTIEGADPTICTPPTILTGTGI